MKSKLSKLKISPTVAHTGKIVHHTCKHCGTEAISYFIQPMWTYPENSDKPLPLYWYCAKHSKEVMASMPKNLQVVTKLIFTNSGRHEVMPEIRNELVLHREEDIAFGKLATKFKQSKTWPKKDDFHVLDIAQLEPEKAFLVYDADGNYKRSYKKYALAEYDPRKEVLVYCGSNCNSSMEFLKMYERGNKQRKLFA